MYLIDIHPHLGGFTNQDLLSILEENWPEIIEPYALKGVDGLTDNASDSDIDSFRKASINTVLQTPGGRFLMPMGEGITGAGTSLKIGIEADRIITNVCQLENSFLQQPDTIAVYFNDKYAKNWDCLKFKLKSFEPPVKIEEITTGEIIEYHRQGGR